jgi:hypothetical protein
MTKVTAMPQLIYPDFLKDAHAYSAAQQYWEAMWAQLLLQTRSKADWEIHWMKNPLANGNPIFTSRSRTLRRGVRIIQEEPGEDINIDLDWWIDDFGDKDDREQIQELVIACCPSVENASPIEQLLKDWLQGRELPPPAVKGKLLTNE